jgi:hypothetical protein
MMFDERIGQDETGIVLTLSAAKLHLDLPCEKSHALTL